MKNVVVIGGGFAGSHIARKLEKVKSFNVILIDRKEYFEFTPSILKAITNPNYLDKIQQKHEKYLTKSKFVCGQVAKISKKEVYVNNKKIPYDYLIIATGSSYVLPFKHHKALQINRGVDIKKYNKKLIESKKIVVVGGGLVGVEIVGEIVDKYKNKKIKLIESNETLIPRNLKASQEYSKRILEKKGVEIMLNQSFKEKSKKEDKELVFICMGIKPNFNFKMDLKEKSLETNEYLQLRTNKNIFVAGDVSQIKEEKTAQNAVNHAKIIVKNITRLERNKPLKKYLIEKTPQIISLGKDKGILEFKNFIVKGKLPIILKNFVERREMRKLRK